METLRTNKHHRDVGHGIENFYRIGKEVHNWSAQKLGAMLTEERQLRKYF